MKKSTNIINSGKVNILHLNGYRNQTFPLKTISTAVNVVVSVVAVASLRGFAGHAFLPPPAASHQAAGHLEHARVGKQFGERVGRVAVAIVAAALAAAVE